MNKTIKAKVLVSREPNQDIRDARAMRSAKKICTEEMCVAGSKADGGKAIGI